MRRNKILIIVIVLILSLIIGCRNKNIILNENTKLEQINDEGRLIVKEKSFKVENISGEHFEPYYIAEDGVYGVNFIETNFGSGNICEVPGDKLKRVSKDGIIEDIGIKVSDCNELPFEVKEKNNSEFIYKNYITGEEKILIEGNPKKSYSEYMVQSNTSISKYIVKNSPYAIVIKLIEDDIGRLNKNINIINVNTGEIYIKDIKLEMKDKSKEVFKAWKEEYFYIGEENVIYSISSEDGSIKKIMLKDGKIIEEEYDKINNSLDAEQRYYIIYSNGAETRIIYDEDNVNTHRIESQSAYKVATKEHEELSNMNSKTGNFMRMMEMIPNGLMFASTNEEHVLVKFDTSGIKLVYKFDFSDLLSFNESSTGRVTIATDEKGKEIIIKWAIVNSDHKIIDEKFKMYEIIE
ncbi:hypothetical protein [Clostridium gasigenes]|uniref:hypothetical protein n=1 Tax=Clostridium gasigenes TaxID=94869 RepID=UPI001C0AB9D1|nr:hypothetical protein [Clostridium gasigenes]MBU3102784.1 hypothetical protein [Clostridium gasigenes]